MAKRAFPVRADEQIQWAGFCELELEECSESGTRLASERHQFKPCEHLHWLDVHASDLLEEEVLPDGSLVLSGFVRYIRVTEGPILVDDDDE